MSTPAEHQTEAPRAASAPPARRGMRGTGRNMVLSMLVVLAGCLAWIAIVPRVSTTAQPVQDVPGIAREVGITQRWQVALPNGLSNEWVPVNVRLVTAAKQPSTWHVGYQTPAEEFVALDQTQGGDQAWVRRQVGEATPSGTVTLAGAGWTRYEKDDRRVLVRAQPLAGLSTVVSGKADWAELEKFARALRPTQPSG